jgi:ATP-binding cassette subfamily B multidrug efflux pump
MVLSLLLVLVSQILKASDERQERLDDLNDTPQENLVSLRVVKGFVREDYEVERFEKRAKVIRPPAYTGSLRFSPKTERKISL